MAEPFYAVAAEFETGEALLEAARHAKSNGLHRLHAYGPVPMPEVAALLGESGGSTRLVGTIGGIVGAAGFFSMCAYATTISYVFDIGGRPRMSWPYFIIPSVSIGALGATLAVSFAFLFLCRLPRLNHPAFNAAGFGRVSRDRFFLTVEPEPDDANFDARRIERTLRETRPAPIGVEHVAR